MNEGIYVWGNGQVVSIIEEQNLHQQLTNLGLLDCYICDTRYSSERSRYGSYTKSEVYLSGVCWQGANYKDLPNEFKTHLLLLGIT